MKYPMKGNEVPEMKNSDLIMKIWEVSHDNSNELIRIICYILIK